MAEMTSDEESPTDVIKGREETKDSGEFNKGPSIGKFIETSEIDRVKDDDSSIRSESKDVTADHWSLVRPLTEPEPFASAKHRRVRFSMRSSFDDDDDWDEPPPHRLTWAEKKLLLSARQQSAPAKLSARNSSVSGDDDPCARSAWHSLPPVKPIVNGDLQKFIDVETIRRQLTLQRLQQDTLLQRNAIMRRQKDIEYRRQVTEDNMLKYLHRRRSTTANNDILNPPSLRVGQDDSSAGLECPNANDSKEARIVKERLQRKASGKITHYVPMCPRVILGNLPPEVRALHRAEMRKRGLIGSSRSAIPGRRKAVTDVR